MMKAAICIDTWKLKTFKKILDEENYTYTEHPGLTKDTLTLTVNFDDIEKLKPVIARCQHECTLN